MYLFCWMACMYVVTNIFTQTHARRPFPSHTHGWVALNMYAAFFIRPLAL